MSKLIFPCLICLFLCNGAKSDERQIAAFLAENQTGAEVTSCLREILSNSINNTYGLRWISPDDEYRAIHHGGIFIQPDLSEAEDYFNVNYDRERFSHLVKYRLRDCRWEFDKNLSLPYLLNRFSRILYVELEYVVSLSDSAKTVDTGVFEFSMDFDDYAQFFEYDQYRADILVDAIELNRFCREIAAEIGSRVQTHLIALRDNDIDRFR
ncbi:MAG: hypothetical protein GF315_12890 [candidate division Zixibacteria bacterium]|nr:hypothetical protein [candidate division Zixibacteria bacterium]